MKIVQVSESDHGGGAERISYDLHRAALAGGHDSRMLVGFKRGDDPRVTPLVPGKGTSRFCYRCARFLERRSGLQARLYWMAGSWLRKNSDALEVIHLHNVHGQYFNLGVLPSLSRRARIIFTLHDCWYFTGHCAVVFDCTGWMDSCTPCCDIGRYPGMERDAAGYNLLRKKRLFAEANPILVTPSQWLCDLVQRSTVFRGFDCRVIGNGIDTGRFTPGDRISARGRLGLPYDRRIMLYVVNGGLNATQYKDPDLLLAAVQRLLAGPLAGKFHLAVVGGKKEIPGTFRDCVSQFGETQEGLETFYQAADLLVHPTKADSSSLVSMEAMSCGLPVVTARIGGVPEVVVHGVTGFVTNPGDLRDFTEAIESLLSSDSLMNAMGRASLQRARTNFTLESMTESYLRLYREAIGGGNGRGHSL